MSKYPYMAVFHCRLLMSALGAIGILLTASCPRERVCAQARRLFALRAAATALPGVVPARSGWRVALVAAIVLLVVALVAWGRGCHAVHSLDGGVEVGGRQLAGGPGTEPQAGDVLRHGEVFLGVGSAFHLQAYGEDGEVGELDVLAEQQKLLGADHGVCQDALDGSLAERGVVARHVLRQLVETDGLVRHHSWIPLLVGITLGIVVLIQCYSYHFIEC